MSQPARTAAGLPFTQVALFGISIVLLVGGCSLRNMLSGPSGANDEIPLKADTALWLDYDQALRSSRETGKPVLLFFTGSDWCPWCQRLNDEVFETDEFRDWAATNISLVEVDFPQEKKLPGDRRIINETLKKTYDSRIKGFPTALFIDGNGTVLGRLGYEGGGPKPWIKKASQVISASSRLASKEVARSPGLE
jgi:protein disulfide-isomerase